MIENAEDADLATRVNVLWDIEQIKQLKARYFRLTDSRDWVGVRGLFTDDCTFTSPGTVGVDGPDAFVQRVEELITPGVSVHHGHMPEITIHDSSHASGIWAMYDYLELEGRPDRAGSHGYGHYLESYRKDEGHGWRISRWELVRIRVDQF